MALSRLNFLKRLDARARVLVLLGAVVGLILLVYIGTRLLWSDSNTTGPSKVATAPQGLQSVPGGQVTAAYQQALQQANAQAAQQAQISGSSAVPTMINIGNQATSGANCIICSDQSANVRNLLDDWVRQGQVLPEIAVSLQQLADKNVSVEDYAAALDQLVRDGKLTPEQARLLLEQYKKQHANALLAESAKTMDNLIKAGQLPLDVANQLLDAQRAKLTPSQYAALLQDLERQGKISAGTSQQLLSQYAQQRAKEIVLRSIASLRQMARAGQITPDVEKDLIDLETRMVPVDSYASVLQKYVTDGKMTPAVSTKILDEFKSQKAEIGSTASLSQLLQQAEAAAYQELRDLVAAKKMPPEVAAQLASMIQQNVTMEQFKATIDLLVQQQKITPEIAKLKLADYQQVKGLRELSARLAALQGNNGSSADYADLLKKAVQAGLLTPEQAAQLMKEYQAISGVPVGGPATLATGQGSEEFAQLQQRVQQGTAQTTVIPAEEFATAQVVAQGETDQDRQNRIQALMTAMAGQAQQLVLAWQPPKMERKAGTATTTTKGTSTETGAEGKAVTTTTTTTSDVDTSIPLIKSGTILFAVLDTAVNSDYPTSPVMATVVSGKYKGAKLLGKLVTTKGIAGQMDRISLNFTLMNLDEWPKSKTVTAYAIDPDTARSVMASSVDYHYAKRFGAIMATSFLQGYASALTTSGSTATTGIFGTSQAYPQLDPRQKLFVGLGQMGQTLGAATQNYINIPPTVRVDSGVGLGILFMADVTA